MVPTALAGPGHDALGCPSRPMPEHCLAAAIGQCCRDRTPLAGLGSRWSPSTHAQQLGASRACRQPFNDRPAGMAKRIREFAHTSAILPSLTKGQRLMVPVDGGLVYAEVIEVTKLTTDVPVKWKLLARELA